MEKTWQTTSWANGDDGDHQSGVKWPNPRFTDNLDGTITDNLTGLIWLKNANCFGQRTWDQAISDCNGLADGTCGLTDGSSAGDWRFPNLKEILSLIDYDYYNPAISNTAGTGKWSEDDPFTNVQFGYYWSSSTGAGNTQYGWYMIMGSSYLAGTYKTTAYYVWPVRGGH